jgi:hypothetical protein
VIWRDTVDLTGDPQSGVIAMLGMAGILRAAHANPRYAYLVIDPALAAARAFSTALGAVHVPELDLERYGNRVECHIVDFGPGGLLRAQRDLVYRELGLPPPSLPPPSAFQPAELLTVVRFCLRHFADSEQLAGTPLARGETVSERADSVRKLLERGITQAFGSRPSDELNARVLLRGYIEPGPSHEQAAEELHLSRSAYFRRLKEATERLARSIGTIGT